MNFHLNDVGVQYNGIPALSNVTVNFTGATVTLITGQTGAGKSTLLKLLTADVLPTSGTVLIDDVSTTTMKPRTRRAFLQRMGIVQQDCRLLETMTAFENVLVPFALRGMNQADSTAQCLQLFADMNISYVRNKLPHQLSGGERHLVALARALASRPEVIIADEPTGTLDDTTAQTVAQILKSAAAKGSSLILSTHSASLVAEFQYANHIVLHEGTLVTATTAGDVV